MPASIFSSERYLLTINGQCCQLIKQNNTGFFNKTTVKDTTKVLAKNSSDILTNMFIAAQQRTTNEVPELFKWEVALPPPSLTIPTTGAVKFATKASVVESLASFTKKHPSNNDAIFMDRGVTTVIIDASVMIRKNALRTATGRLKDTSCS